ncbi:unnamed protein product [Jaminaea pallidilutea]
MGITFSSLFGRLAFWSRDEDVRILMLGLDSAGKTTILYRLQIGDVVSTIPTIGFNVETLAYKNVKFQVWDLGGQTSIRPYWRCYYGGTKAVIYVIDSSDHARLALSKSELHSLLNEDELKSAKLLVFANKQDVQGAASPAEITEQLGLTKLKDREWTIVKSVAIKGEGLDEGMDWLVNSITAK